MTTLELSPQRILEAALLAAGRPLPADELLQILGPELCPNAQELQGLLKQLESEYQNHVLELVQVASGYRFQVRSLYGPAIAGLWQERAPRYSRALLETLAIIAYRQPITRGEIEDIRGVAVASNIIKTLMERHWIRVVGRREVPGRPALYATTKAFLDYFNLQSLEALPSLAELRDLASIERELDLNDPEFLPEDTPATETETRES